MISTVLTSGIHDVRFNPNCTMKMDFENALIIGAKVWGRNSLQRISTEHKFNMIGLQFSPKSVDAGAPLHPH